MLVCESKINVGNRLRAVDVVDKLFERCLNNDVRKICFQRDNKTWITTEVIVDDLNQQVLLNCEVQ